MYLFVVSLVLFLTLSLAGYFGLTPSAPALEEKENAQVQTTGQSHPTIFFYHQGLNQLQQGDFEEAIQSLNRFLKESPPGRQAEDATYLLADAYFGQAGQDLSMKPQVVLDAYQRALSLYPKSPKAPWARLQIGEIRKQSGLYYEALASFDILLDNYPAGPYHMEAQKKKADCLFKIGRYQDAEKEYRSLSTDSLSESTQAEVAFGLADISLYLGNPQKALDAYRTALSKFPQQPLSDPSILYRFGETLFKNQQFQEARKVFESLVAQFPQEDFSPPAATRIADCYLEEQNVEEALESYGQVLFLYPETESALTAKMRMADIGIHHPGKSLDHKRGNFEPYLNPLETYEKVASKYPRHPLAEVALYRKGLALNEAKRYEEAAVSLKAILSRYPKGFFRIETLSALGEALERLILQYYEQNKHDQVIRVYQRDVIPSMGMIIGADILWKVAESYESLGIWKSTEKLYKRLSLLSREPDQKASATLRLSEIYLAMEDYPAALEQLQKILSQFPKTKHLLRVYRLLGDLFFHQGKPKEAAEAYRKALARESDSGRSAEIRYLLANCYWEIEDFLKAETSYRLVLQVASKKGLEPSLDYLKESRFRLADALYRLGKYSEAAQAYASAIRTHPQDDRRARASYRLADCYQRSNQKEAAVEVLRSLADEEKGGSWSQMAAGKLQEMDWEINP